MSVNNQKSYDDLLLEMIRKDHPELSEQEVLEVHAQINQLSNILIDEWIWLKENRHLIDEYKSQNP